MDKIEYANVARRPDVKDVVARWLWDFWGAPGNFDFYRSMVEHSQEDDFPLMYVALAGNVPVGTVSLLRADLFSRQDLYPWMADLYVPPEYRSRGIGSALQDFALAEAKERGFREVFLYTPLTGYYEKKGWEYVGDEMDRDCQIVRVYQKKIV